MVENAENVEQIAAGEEQSPQTPQTTHGEPFEVAVLPLEHALGDRQAARGGPSSFGCRG